MSGWQRGHDDVLAALAPPAALVEQPERLADAGRVAEEDLQLSSVRGPLGGLTWRSSASTDREQASLMAITASGASRWSSCSEQLAIAAPEVDLPGRPTSRTHQRQRVLHDFMTARVRGSASLTRVTAVRPFTAGKLLVERQVQLAAR